VGGLLDAHVRVLGTDILWREIIGNVRPGQRRPGHGPADVGCGADQTGGGPAGPNRSAAA
jgi:hypothetical protein